MIRLASSGDAPQMAEIYRPYCEASHTSFETTAPSAEEMAARIAKGTVKLPWLVEEEQGVVAGYAYATLHRERPAYRWTVEVTIYVRADRHGKGLGRALYTALLGILRRQHYVNAFAIVALPNLPSVCFHKAMGFTTVGTFNGIGYKHGAWRTTEWLQLLLTDPKSPPLEPIPLPEFIGGPGWAVALAEGEGLLKRQPATL